MRKHLRIGIKKLFPWASLLSSQCFVTKIFLVPETQAVLSLSDILRISCPARFLLAFMCFHVWLLSCMCVYRLVHRPSWRPEVMNWLREEGGLSSTLWPWDLCQFGLFPWEGSWNQAIWDWLEPPSPHVPLPSTPQTGWSLGSSLSDEGNLALICLIVFPCSGFRCFFFFPSQGHQVSLHLWTRFLLCDVFQTIPGLPAYLYHSCLLPGFILFFPSNCPFSHPTIHQYHNVNKSFSYYTNKGQIFKNFLQGFITFLASLVPSPFFFSIPSPFSPDFSCLLLPLLHSGVWTELRITNVCAEKSYLKQANNPWAVVRLFSKCLLPTSNVA